MTAANTKAGTMSESDNQVTQQVLTTFIKNLEQHEKRLDEKIDKLADQITNGLGDIARAVAATESHRNQISDLYNKHDQATQERIASSRVNWFAWCGAAGTILFVLGGVLTFILVPINEKIGNNLQSANANQAALMAKAVNDAERFARIEMRQAWAEDVLMLMDAHDNQLSRAWVDESGRIAHPSRSYTPLKGNP